MIIVTFTKLFMHRIVASVLSLSSRIICILASLSDFSGSISDKSFGDKLKKAISEPLATPEATRRITASTIAITTAAEGAVNVTSAIALYNDEGSKL